MGRSIHARVAQLRAIDVFSKRPEVAQVLNRGTAEARDGLSCTYEQDGHHLFTDMPTAIGGNDEGSAPGFYGRAAVCNCHAIGVNMTATREDLHLGAVKAGTEQAWDNREVLAMDGARPVPSDTRTETRVTSSEPTC